MSKKPKISQEDIAAFYQAVKGTKPLQQKQIRIPRPTQLTKNRKPIIVEHESIYLNETLSQPLVKGEEFISFKQNGIASKILRKLSKGQYNIEAILDLHGMTIEEAKLAVEKFIGHCLHEKIRVVLIIHGKGLGSKAPILKNKLNLWLRTDCVLAFCSAAPSHGNRGAIYVLLRRDKQETFVE